MKRLPCLLLLLLAGCSSVMHLGITAADAEAIGLQFRDGLCVDSDGALFVATPANIVRYDPDEHCVEVLLLEKRYDIVDLAMTPDDMMLALCERSLAAVFAGQLVPLVELPERGRKVSSRDDTAFVLTTVPGGGSHLLRYSYGAKTLEGLLQSDQEITAICAVRGGCLFAVGDSVFKLLEPGADGVAEVVLLFAIARTTILSLAADPDDEVVYAADADMTYAWSGGQVRSFHPMGGEVCWNGGVLAIVSPELRQAQLR